MSKKVSAALLLTVPLMAAAFGSGAAVQAQPSPDESAVSILYFNDGHEISPVTDKLGTRGGVARIKSLVDGVQGDKIVAFGGDLGGGTLFGGVFKGFPMVEAFNRIPVDVANFGQHDFDAGPANTLELIQASSFGWITSNLTGKDGSPFGGVPQYRVYEKQGIRIGFIGLTSAMETTTQDDAVRQNPVIASAKAAVEKLKAEHRPDLIVALTQEPVQDDKALLQAVPDIRIVFTEEEAEERSFSYELGDGKKQYILAPQGNMGSIAHVKIGKRADGQVEIAHDFLKADETVTEDVSLAALAAEYQAKLDTALAKKIATAGSGLPYGDNHESRFQETAIGNLIADAYRDYYRTDAAFANGGGIRASIKEGGFSLKDARSVLPFGNKIVVAEVTGSMLLDALENSVAAVDKLAGGFLQVSGISYTYNPSLPAGSRIVRADIGGKPVEKERAYKLALSNYMYTGGDKYTMFGKAKTLVGASEAVTDFELLSAYVEKKGSVDAKLEGRIRVDGFADVTSDHWAARSVYGLSGKGFMTGADGVRFIPNGPATRGEFIGHLAKVLCMEQSKIESALAWSAGLREEKLVREDMAVALKWALENKTGNRLTPAAAVLEPFTDGPDISAEARPAVSALVQHGTLAGRQDHQFAPKEPATRAEVAHVLWKLVSGEA